MLGSRDPRKEEVCGPGWPGRARASGPEAPSPRPRRMGILLVLAVLGAAVEEAIAEAEAESLGGKVVIDATNPLDFSAGFPPKLAVGDTDSRRRARAARAARRPAS